MIYLLIPAYYSSFHFHSPRDFLSTAELFLYIHWCGFFYTSKFHYNEKRAVHQAQSTEKLNKSVMRLMTRSVFFHRTQFPVKQTKIRHPGRRTERPPPSVLFSGYRIYFNQFLLFPQIVFTDQNQNILLRCCKRYLLRSSPVLCSLPDIRRSLPIHRSVRT